MKRSYNKIYLILILLLGTTLRIYKLGTNSLWLDEASFILFRSDSGGFWGSLKYIWEKIFRSGFGLCNFGYTLFTTCWSSFLGGEFMLRLPSVFFGIACIILIYKVGEILFDKKTGLITAFMLAISPFHIYYSQEFRMYSLISLLSLLSVYFFWQFLQSGKYRELWGYIIFHVLNFYMHIATILILFAQIIFFTFYQKKYRDLFKKWLLGQTIITFLIAPGIIITIIELTRIGSIKDILRMTVSTVTQVSAAPSLIPFYTFKNFCIGYYGTSWIGCLALLLFFALFVWAQFKAKEKEAIHLCLCCLFLPMFVLFVGQRFAYADRYLIPSSLFLYLITGRGVASLKKPLVIVALLLVFILSSLALNNYYTGSAIVPVKQRISIPDKQAYREAAKYIFDNFQEGDVIFHTECNTGIPFLYYFNYYFNRRGANPKIIFSKEEIYLTLYFTQDRELSCFRNWDEVGKIVSKNNFPVIGHKRVWLVFSSWNFEKACKPDSDERKKLTWIENKYIKKEVRYFKDITIYLFINPQKKYEKSFLN